tara:strand:+ start:105 stop:302 length:198 start_codon:yes stop_codon:yes gene_type:complete
MTATWINPGKQQSRFLSQPNPQCKVLGDDVSRGLRGTESRSTVADLKSEYVLVPDGTSRWPCDVA